MRIQIIGSNSSPPSPVRDQSAESAESDGEAFELDNYREKLSSTRNLLEGLFPIIDNFEMGLKAAQDGERESSMIFQGMSMVFKQISDFQADQGVEIIPSDGVAFDPNVHEAIKQEPSEEVAEGQILYTMRRGYRLKDRVLRAANVVVSSGADEG